MARRRGRTEILLDVLESLEPGPLPPTRLATAANLPYDRLVPILDRLEEAGAVRLVEGERGRLVVLTPRGREILEELRRVRRLLSGLGLDVL